MTSLQFAASNPHHSVWVGASAGTGKTKVLTDRVLRLLLNGVLPAKILCLTFTNAAAAEMANRINKKLSDWAIMPEAELVAHLTALTALPPDISFIRRARQLFARVLDAPGGLKIQTIHAFCQALMRQFPLEAKIAPHFTIIDERTTAELQAEARLRLLNFASSPHDARGMALKEAIGHIAWQLHENSLNSLLQELTEGRAKLEAIIAKHGGMQGVIAALYHSLGVTADMDEKQLRQALCSNTSFDHTSLRECCRALLEGGVKDKEKGEKMASFLAATKEERQALLADYMQAFLTKELEPRNPIANKPILAKNPKMEETLRTEQRRLQAYIAQSQALKAATLTRHLLCIAEHLLAEYHSLKASRSFLDFNDLIFKAVRLLADPSVSQWILYKQEGGIDHILVDEAQDTSPEQWQIIDSICTQFFASTDQSHLERSLFVVGDEKQSIFSFQGADPSNFNKMQQLLRHKTETASKSFRSINLDRSFRSTSAVLGIVDRVFSSEQYRAAVCSSPEIIRHDVNRIGHAGMVELWPLISPPPKEEAESAWELPTTHRPECNTQKILAELIAHTIYGWLEEKRPLTAKGRPVTAGDILILVRRRKAFSQYLITALKKRNIPVAGSDRMVITDHIAVMDMMALGRFLLLPQDDLTLATVLKTPLIALSEEDLFTLAYEREPHSLWEQLQLKKEDSPTFYQTYHYLVTLRIEAETLSPFELYSSILEVQGGRAKLTGRIGEEAGDALDEFLSLALSYEQVHTPTLQGFLHWLETGSTQIKRDMEQGRNQVRIMTVHGAKGLQAPIIFLPDTTQLPSNRKSLLWDEELVLWPGSGNKTPLAVMIKEKNKLKEMEEYLRLLYVGLTRAEDEMIVCGWQGKNAIAAECWYNIVKAGLLGEAEEVPFIVPDTLGYSLPATTAPVTLRFACTQDIPPVITPSFTNKPQEHVPLPLFLQQSLAREVMPAAPLMPSALNEAPSAARSPLLRAEHYRFQRGNLIHTLLQFLPAVPLAQQAEAVTAYLSRYGRDFHPAAQGEIKRQVLSLLRHTAFAPVFGPNSKAEVPITGTIHSKSGEDIIISGQIDRLLVEENTVLVVDYKSNQCPPECLEDIPTSYITQMAAYYALLRAIYPDKQIECALIWTETPILMPIPEEILKKMN